MPATSAISPTSPFFGSIGRATCSHIVPAQRRLESGRHKRAKTAAVFDQTNNILQVMSRRIPSKVASALSAVVSTALILDPTCSTSSSCCAYAFTPTSGTATSLRTSGPLHLMNDRAGDSLVPQNSLQSMDRRIMASSSMRIPATSTSSNLVASRRDRMALYAAKNKGGEIDYANMTPQV